MTTKSKNPKKITEDYYYFLVDATNAGIIKADVSIVVHPNGNEQHCLN